MIIHETKQVYSFEQATKVIKQMQQEGWEVAAALSDDGDYLIVFKKEEVQPLSPHVDDIPLSLDEEVILHGRHFGD